MWLELAFLAINLVLSAFLRPSIGSDVPEPAKLGDLEVPTAEEGKPIAVLFGQRHIRAPNVIWYGHLRTVPIKSEGGGKK